MTLLLWLARPARACIFETGAPKARIVNAPTSCGDDGPGASHLGGYFKAPAIGAFSCRHTKNAPPKRGRMDVLESFTSRSPCRAGSSLRSMPMRAASPRASAPTWPRSASASGNRYRHIQITRSSRNHTAPRSYEPDCRHGRLLRTASWASWLGLALFVDEHEQAQRSMCSHVA
jgi:hypothetical protein